MRPVRAPASIPRWPAPSARPRQDEVRAQLAAAIEQVATLDADRVLRTFANLIEATLRTNYFQNKPHLSFKLNPAAIDGLPFPRPMFEIWVYSPRVEGVHLRFGKVARGGLRWSDRREDFRTEILGLVKAQTVKNAVIVPTGAKGGFFAKQLPDPAVDRAAWMAEGIESYKTFIRGLLDITDNLVTDAGRRNGGAAGGRRAARRRRFLPGGRGGQGHGVLLRHRQRAGRGVRLLARRRLRLRRLGGLRPQGHGHHRPRRLGVGQAPLQRAGPGHAVRALHRGRRRRHVRRRLRQRHAALQAHPPAGRLRPPAHLPRSRPRTRPRPSRSGSGSSSCPGPPGTTTTSR